MKYTTTIECSRLEGMPERLEIEYYTVRDEKSLISAATGIEYYKNLYDMIYRKVTNFDARKLLANETEGILAVIRSRSAGIYMEIVTTCEACGTKINSVADLRKMPQIPLKEEYKEPFSVLYNNGEDDIIKMNLRLPRIWHREIASTKVHDDNYDFVMDAACLDFGLTEESLKDAINKLYDMRPIEQKIISNFRMYFKYGVRPITEVECFNEKCKRKSMVLLPFYSRDLFTSSGVPKVDSYKTEST